MRGGAWANGRQREHQRARGGGRLAIGAGAASSTSCPHTRPVPGLSCARVGRCCALLEGVLERIRTTLRIRALSPFTIAVVDGRHCPSHHAVHREAPAAGGQAEPGAAVAEIQGTLSAGCQREASRGVVAVTCLLAADVAGFPCCGAPSPLGLPSAWPLLAGGAPCLPPPPPRRPPAGGASLTAETCLGALGAPPPDARFSSTSSSSLAAIHAYGSAGISSTSLLSTPLSLASTPVRAR